MIVSGTIATKRTVHRQNSTKWKHQVGKIKEAYDINKGLSITVIPTYENSAHVLSSSKFLLVRNTVYVFAKNKCIARHDKNTPLDETASLNNSIFRPGIGRNRANQINFKLSVQICLEQNTGALVKFIKNIPLQLVVSNSTICDSQKVFSPYMVQVDKYLPTLLLTNTPTEKLEVIVSNYDMSSCHLIAVEPTTLYHHTFKNLREAIIQNRMSINNLFSEVPCNLEVKMLYMVYFKRMVLDHQNQHILNTADYMLFIKLILEKYGLPSSRNFASAILSLFIENTSNDPQQTSFQQYLTQLINSDDNQFISELLKINNDINLEHIQQLYSFAEYKLIEPIARLDLIKIKTDAEDEFKSSERFNPQRFNNFITARVMKLNEDIEIIIEELLHLLPDTSSSYHEHCHQLIKFKNLYDLNQLACVYEQLLFDQESICCQISDFGKNIAKNMLNSPILLSYLSPAELSRRHEDVRKLIGECVSSKKMDDYDKLQKILTIYNDVMRDFPLIPQPVNSCDNNLGHYIDLCISAESGLSASDSILKKQRLEVIKKKAKQELSLTGTFDSIAFENFISNRGKTSLSCSQFSPRSRQTAFTSTESGSEHKMSLSKKPPGLKLRRG